MNKISMIQNVEKIYSEPFPHIHIENALPEKIYNELESSFPQDLICAANNIQNEKYTMYRYPAQRVLKDGNIPNIWRDFFEYHVSLEYFRSCTSIFEPYLEKLYPQFLDKFHNESVAIRNVGKAPLVSDCQFVVHEPVGETSTTRTPHIDISRKIFAGLMYMRIPGDESFGGNFTLHKVVKQFDEVNHKKSREVDNKFHKPVKEIPYIRNNFVMFLNVLESVHSVTPRINPTYNRWSINTIVEFKDNNRMWQLK